MTASINKLPIELLDIIFQDVAIPDSEDYRCPGYILQLPDVPDLNMFPLNVAGVCSLWLSILKSHPQLWQRVLVNVASNPAPFLETLNLFKAGRASEPDHRGFIPPRTTTLDLIIFSSDPSIDKYLEHSRTRLVFEHLLPVIHRYSRIIFRLVYQSSLPSSAEILLPHASKKLRELFLTCTTYDLCDNDVDDSDFIGADDDTPFLGPTIPTCLNELSLTGFDFMHLCLAGLLKTKWGHNFRLSITHYKFRRHFAVLMEVLQSIGEADAAGMYILLSDISLECGPSQEIISKYGVSVQKILFANVSTDFISAFFSAITFADDELEFVSFHNCVIPRIGKWNRNISVAGDFDLELIDIPYTSNYTTEPSSTALNPHIDDSLCNAIEAFPVQEVRILRCNGVNDRFLSWLSGEDSVELEAHKLETLKLYDCTNFTSKGVCNFLVNRRRRIRKHAERRRFTQLEFMEVFGKGPAIDAEDVLILKGKHNSKRKALHKTHVSWNVEPSDSHQPGCVTDLQPLSAETARYKRENWGIDTE